MTATVEVKVGRNDEIAAQRVTGGAGGEMRVRLGREIVLVLDIRTATLLASELYDKAVTSGPCPYCGTTLPEPPF